MLLYVTSSECGVSKAYGLVFAQDGKTLQNEVEVIEGMKFDQGHLARYFITDPKTGKCVRALSPPTIPALSCVRLHGSGSRR